MNEVLANRPPPEQNTLLPAAIARLALLVDVLEADLLDLLFPNLRAFSVDVVT